MPAVKIGINGFGRIGRLVFRALVEQGLLGKIIDVVAVNDLVPADNLAYLLKYDSILGNLHHTITAGDDFISVDGKKLKVYAERDPAKLDWSSVGAQVVIGSPATVVSGNFTVRLMVASNTRSPKASTTRSTETCPRPKPRTPGVSMPSPFQSQSSGTSSLLP